MSDLPWFQFYPNDWLAGTRGLSAVETGIYITIIATLYDRAAPLPNDTERLARMCGAGKRQFVSALQRLLDDGKLCLVDGGIWNTRVDEELKNRNDKREKAKEAAEARWSGKTKENQSPRDATASNEQCQTDASQKSEVRSQKSDSLASPAVVDGKPAAWVALGQKISDSLGLTNDPRWMGNWSIVNAWMAKGFDGELDIWPTVVAIVERKKALGQSLPKSLNYFSRAIEENHKRRVESGVAAPLPRAGQEVFLVKQGSREFAAWIAHYKGQGRKTGFMENMREMTVPSMMPPQEAKAA